MTMRF